MKEFVARFASLVIGALSGFDRLVLRGTLLPLMPRGAFFHFLQSSGVRSVDYKAFVVKTSEKLKVASLAEARELGRPIQYLESPSISKEDLARELLAKHPVEQGLICAFSALEPCMTFKYRQSSNKEERGYRLSPSKCLHLYKYLLHPRFGFMNVRIQTWFPFKIQICLNGREWLSRLLEERGVEFTRHDNCFTHLGDPELAQRLMDSQLKTDWPRALDNISRIVNPSHDLIFKDWPMEYYWTAFQSEWATDIMFKDPASLAKVYPDLVRFAMHNFHSPDVMRFLGRKVNGHFKGEIISSFKDRPEGVRVKHYVNTNSVKMYDKGGNVLRVEATLNETNGIKVYRPKESHPQRKREWQQLRKGVSDLHRRAKVSQQINSNYLEALSTVADTTPCSQVFDSVSRPVFDDKGRRTRAMRLNDNADLTLLQTISRGEFAASGFRNRDICQILYPVAPSPEDRPRLSAKTTRQLRLLHAHGIIRKVPKTRRYRLTKRGQILTAALFASRTASIKQLLDIAA